VTITIDKITDTHQFESLRNEWDSLLGDSQSDGFFLTWEWLFTWWKHLGGDCKLSILRVHANANLLAILPFFRGKVRPSQFQPACLELLGSGVAGSDYLDLIIRTGYEAEVVQHVRQFILSEGRTVKLSHYLQDSSTVSSLMRSWQTDAQTREGLINVCPFIDLTDHTWDTYLASLGAEHRYNFRRRLKRLQAKFEVRLDVVQQESERRAALANLIHLHNLRRNSLGGTEAFSTPALRAFHDDVSNLTLQRGWLRLYTLWLDERPAASLYGFLYKETFYFYQSGFDPGFSEYSVGLVMMGLAIRCAIEEGAREYDFLHGAERYKFLWTNSARYLACSELYPPGLRGSMWKAVRESNEMMRVMARKMLSGSGAAREIPATIKSGGAVYVAGRG
jgi:CelD/BcsL family acetyltransferase involved in cellulose biosynthesis